MRLQDIKTGDEELRVMIESGLILREAGRLDEAEQIFRGINELVPHSDVLLIALSSIAARRGDFDEALRLCDKALQEMPESLFARVNRAEILLYQQKREQAEAELREIIETDPDSPHSRTAEVLLDVARMIPETVR
jgi:predicted Zn-dependent protease